MQGLFVFQLELKFQQLSGGCHWHFKRTEFMPAPLFLEKISQALNVPDGTMVLLEI